MFANRSFGRSVLPPTAGALAAVFCGLVLFVDQGVAQAKATASKAAAAKEDKLPEPEEVQLQTSDGVALHATYWPGTKGKDTVPLILLHEFKGKRTDFGSLARYLQQCGHAVLAPDLRGHGQSVQKQGGVVLDPDRMGPGEFVGMIVADVEACKLFLRTKNNEGKLNIERLGVIGAEMGAAVAANWARQDWSWPMLVTGKQGQDVKALVLISPQRIVKGVKGVGLLPVLNDPMVASLPALIVVGKETPKEFSEARAVFSLFKRRQGEKTVNLDPTLTRPDPNNTAEKLPGCTLFFLPLQTKLQGTKMLDFETLRVNQQIAGFVKLRLADPSFPWSKRGRSKNGK